MNFRLKFQSIAKKNQSLLCIGLDNHSFEFNKKIIDATYDLVCAYKPNSAFYEAQGAEGIAELKTLCLYLQDNHPEVPIILDFKRGDIGNTNEQYARYAFEYLKVDAVTLHPYQGLGALSPFEKYSDKGLIALVKTSNPESSEIQDMKLENGKMVWEQVLETVSQRDNRNDQWGVVVGATHPDELKRVRAMYPKILILVPGVGAQGATIFDVLNDQTCHGSDMIINVSRAVINSPDPRKAAKEVQLATRNYANI